MQYKKLVIAFVPFMLLQNVLKTPAQVKHSAVMVNNSALPYNANNTYGVFELVTSGGNTYVSVASPNQGNAVTNTNYWIQIGGGSSNGNTTGTVNPAFSAITGQPTDNTNLANALSAKAASNASTSVNGQTCALGSSCTIAVNGSAVNLKTNGAANGSQTVLNLAGSGATTVAADNNGNVTINTPNSTTTYGTTANTAAQGNDSRIVNSVSKLFPAGTVLNCHGDSIYAGYDNANPATQNPCYDWAQIEGWTAQIDANPGDTFTDMMQRINFNTPITQTTLTTTNIGVNQQAVFSNEENAGAPTLTHTVEFQRLLDAWLLYFSTPDTFKIKGTAMSCTNDWVTLGSKGGNPSWAMLSGTNGGTCTFHAYGTRIDVIASIEGGLSGTTGQGYKITVDGNPVTDTISGTTLFQGETTDSLGQNGGQFGMVDISVSGLPNTNHTVVLTNTEPTNTGTTIFWGQGETPSPVNLTYPPVFLTLVERFGVADTDAHHSDTVTSAYRNIEIAAVQDLNTTAGMHIVATDITGGDGYDPNNSAQMNTDWGHPNPAGAQLAANHWHNVLMSLINQVPSGTSGVASSSSGASAGNGVNLALAGTGSARPGISEAYHGSGSLISNPWSADNENGFETDFWGAGNGQLSGAYGVFDPTHMYFPWHVTQGGQTCLGTPYSTSTGNISACDQSAVAINPGVGITAHLPLGVPSIHVNPYTPTGSTPCSPGDFKVDATNIYVCTAANTWKYAPLSGSITPATAYYAQTSFNEASSGTALNGTQPATTTNNANWADSCTSGGFTYKSGGGVSSSNTSGCDATLNLGAQTNFVISASEANANNAQGFQIKWNYTDANNFYLLHMDSGTFELATVSGGTFTGISNTTNCENGTVPTGNFVVKVQGTNVTATAGSCSVSAVFPANVSVGKYGFTNYSGDTGISLSAFSVASQ